LLSINSAYLLLGVAFLVGVLLVALGSWLIRREKARAVIPSVVEGPPLTHSPPEEVFELVIDQIERLAMVGQPWCVEQLERDFLHADDARVRNAAEDAIIVIRARGW
jgi:hypothetical protein